jgi:Putative Actinobacterial Holin-X, holin superfamily III
VTGSSVRQRADATADHSIGELVQRASQQTSDLIRQEMALARAEMTQKGKRAGLGGGMFGGSALFAIIALQALAAAAIAALALLVPWWAACLVVAGGLLLIAGVLALVGRTELHRVGSPTPTAAIDGVRSDVRQIKERAHR